MNTSQNKIFTKDFFLVFAALLCTALVMYVLMSTVTEYATSLGSSAMVAGLVSGIYVFGGLCSRIYSGNTLERIGWKRTALIFMSIHFLSCILYFAVNDVSLLIVVRFIHGIGFGASANAIVTIASAVLPKKRFGEAFGYFMMGTTLAVGLGPFIGGFLYDCMGSAGCFEAAGIFSALALIFIYFVNVSDYDPVNRSNETSKHNNYKGIDKVFEMSAVPVSLFTAITSLGYISVLSFNRLYASQIHMTNIFSWFFIIYAVVLLISRPMAGKIQDNGGDIIVCIVGIIAQAIGLLLISVYPSPITVIICAVGAALGFGTLNSACTTIVTRNTSEERRSYAVSTFFIFCDATMGFGPALLGIFAINGYAQVFMISSLITLLALPICIYALRN